MAVGFAPGTHEIGDFTGYSWNVGLGADLSISFAQSELTQEVIGSDWSVPLSAALAISVAQGSHAISDFYSGSWSVGLASTVAVNFESGTYEIGHFVSEPWDVGITGSFAVEFASSTYTAGSYEFEYTPVVSLRDEILPTGVEFLPTGATWFVGLSAVATPSFGAGFFRKQIDGSSWSVGLSGSLVASFATGSNDETAYVYTSVVSLRDEALGAEPFVTVDSDEITVDSSTVTVDNEAE